MGSGISLSKPQIVEIIKREMSVAFYQNQALKNRFTDDGIEIPESFDDEDEFHRKIRQLDTFCRRYAYE